VYYKRLTAVPDSLDLLNVLKDSFSSVDIIYLALTLLTHRRIRMGAQHLGHIANIVMLMDSHTSADLTEQLSTKPSIAPSHPSLPIHYYLLCLIAHSVPSLACSIPSIARRSIPSFNLNHRSLHPIHRLLHPIHRLALHPIVRSKPSLAPSHPSLAPSNPSRASSHPLLAPLFHLSLAPPHPLLGAPSHRSI